MGMNNGKILAVWGNPQAGKTTLSCKLAMELAERKKNVILILADIVSPDINIILPFESGKSMGNIWTDPDIEEDRILKKCMESPSQYVSVLGYSHTENIFTYAAYTKRNILNQFKVMKRLCDYIIVDCISDFPNSILTTVTLEIADKVIRMCTPDLKAFSFFDSNLSMLVDSRFRVEDHIRVLSKAKKIHPKEIAINKYGGIEFEYDYNLAIEIQMTEGKLLDKMVDKTMSSNNKMVYKLAETITGEYFNDTRKKKKRKEPPKKTQKSTLLSKKKGRDDYE